MTTARARAKRARDITRLAAIPGLGRARATALAARGVTTRAQLRRILSELPPETRAHLRFRVARRIPAATADAIIAELRRRLTFEVAGRRRRLRVTAVGSARRRAPWSKDIDLLVTTPGAAAPARLLASAKLRAPRRGPATLQLGVVYAAGARRRSLLVRRQVRGGRPRYYALDLFLATRREHPFALFHFTGGRAYNVRVRAHAKRRGYVLNQYGVFCAGARRRAPGSGAIASERGLARYLGITYRAPAARTARA